MGKRLFEALDELNVKDAENGSRLVGVCYDIVSATYGIKEGGTRVTIGVPGNVVLDIDSGELVPILVLADRKELIKLTKD